MNRRGFLAAMGGMFAVGALGFFGYDHFRAPNHSRLHEQLLLLADPQFAGHAATLVAADVLASLLEKGIVSENGTINTEAIEKLAATDDSVVYSGRLYLKSELDLYGLAYLVVAEGMVMLPGFDLMGGDYDKHVVAGAAACESLCNEDKDCHSYTFATEEHPRVDKHKMCWLKNGELRIGRAAPYISGIK